MAQVGIGTLTPNASAKLEVSSSNKGFLPPRVTLTGTADVATIASPATGLMVYNTTTAGTSPSNVTPGIYYYDGSKWQRIINQQPDATIEFNTTDPNSGSPTFNPITPASKDYVYVSTVNNSQWTYNGANYVTYTPPASTAWNLAGGTTDAGSNKTGAISRTGNVGVGTTPTVRLDARATTGDGAVGIGTSAATATVAGAGAVRYSTSSGGVLEYSNGNAWNTMTSNVIKSTVIATNNGSATGTWLNSTSKNVENWTEITDVNNNFNPTTGVFTAPRNGNYSFSFTCTFASSAYLASARIEAWMNSSNGSKIRKSTVGFPANSTYNTETGVIISFVINLTLGETLFPTVIHNSGSDKSLKQDANCNSLSIVEL